MPTLCATCSTPFEPRSASCPSCGAGAPASPAPGGEDARVAAHMATQAGLLIKELLPITSLGFDMASLYALDAWCEETYGPGGVLAANTLWTPQGDEATRIARIGAFLGETLRRLVGGGWRLPPRAPKNLAAARLHLSPQLGCLPLRKAYHRIGYGNTDSLLGLAIELRARLSVRPRDEEREAWLTHARQFEDTGRFGRARFCVEMVSLMWPGAAASLEDRMQELGRRQAMQAVALLGEHVFDFTSYADQEAVPVLGRFGVHCDYSAASLAGLDLLLDERWGTAPQRESAEAAEVLALGCYVGEVMVRSLGGSWTRAPSGPEAATIHWGNDHVASPFEMLARRRREGQAQAVLTQLAALRHALAARRLVAEPDRRAETEAWRVQGASFSKAGKRRLATEFYRTATRLWPQDAALATEAGEAYLGAGLLDAALWQFDHALATDPETSGALLGAARALAQLGRPHDALGRLEVLLRRSPEHPEAQLLRARLLLQAGHAEEALLGFEYALGDVRTETAALVGRGRALVALRRWDEARVALEQALAREPTPELMLDRLQVLAELGEGGRAYEGLMSLGSDADLPPPLRARIDQLKAELEVRPEVLVQRAAAEAARGELVAAVSLYERVLALRPGSVDVLRELATGYSLRHDTLQALRCADEAIAAAPDDERSVEVKAQVLERAGSLEEAIRTLEDGLARIPSSGRLWTRKGLCVARLGDARKALAHLGRAIELDPDDAAAWIAKAELHQAQGDLEGAQRSLGELLGRPRAGPARLVRAARQLSWELSHPGKALEPAQAEAFARRAREKLATDKLDEARTLFEEATLLDPLSASLWLERGDVAAQLSLKLEALECYTKARELTPEDPEVLRRCGRAYLALDRPDESLRAIEQALAVSSSHRGALEVKADVLDRLGRHTEALRVLEAVARLHPADATAALAHADLLHRRGLVRESLEVITRALQHSPRDRELELRGAALRLEAARATEGRTDTELKTAEGVIAVAMAHLESGQSMEALAALERATALDPSNANAWTQRAACLRGMGRTVEALTCLERATTVAPFSSEPYFAKAQLEQEEERREEAVRSYQHFLALDYPPHAAMQEKAREYLASAGVSALDLEELGLFDGFIRPFLKVVAQEAVDPTRRWLQLAASMHGSRPDIAFACHGRALKLDSSLVESWLYRAQYLLDRGRAADALPCLERVLALSPDHALAWWSRAHAEAALGRPERAKSALARYFECARGEPLERLRGATELELRLAPRT